MKQSDHDKPGLMTAGTQGLPADRVRFCLRRAGRAAVLFDPDACAMTTALLGSCDTADAWLVGAAPEHATLARTPAGWSITPLAEVLDPGGSPIPAGALVVGDRLRLGDWELLVVDRDPGTRLELLTGPINDLVLRMPAMGGEIGRDAECPLRVDLPGTSRRHALITRSAGGGWVVDDLGSTNGTFLNGDPVRRPTRLRHGDRLVAGRAVFAFCDAAAADLIGRSIDTPAGRVRIQGLAGNGTTGSTWRGRTDDGRLLAVRIAETGALAAVRPWRPAGNLGEAVLAGGHLPVDQVLAVAEAICQAVRHHPHAGLRPSNVLAHGAGWDVVDGTLAAGFDPSEPVAGPDPRWISPEESTGAPTNVAANLFSAGLLLYYAATGHPPFVGLTRAELAAVRQDGSLPRPNTLNRSLPDGIGNLIGQLLIREACERPTVERVLAWIADLRAGRPIMAPAAGTSVIGAQDGSIRIARLSASLRRSSSRLRRVMGRGRTLAAAATLAVVAGAALLWSWRNDASHQPPAARSIAHEQGPGDAHPPQPSQAKGEPSALPPANLVAIPGNELARQIPPAILAGQHRDVLDHVTAYVEAAHPTRLEPAWEHAVRAAWRALALSPAPDRERWLAAASQVGVDLINDADPPPPADIALVAGEAPPVQATVVVDALVGGPGDEALTCIRTDASTVQAEGSGVGLRYDDDQHGLRVAGSHWPPVPPRTVLTDLSGQRITQDGGESQGPLLSGRDWSLWSHRDEDDRIQPLGLWPMPGGCIGARWAVDGPRTVLASSPADGAGATWGDCMGPSLFYAVVDPATGAIVAARWIDADPAPQVVDAWGRIWLATQPGGGAGLTVISADLARNEAVIPLGTVDGNGRFLAAAAHGDKLVLAGQARSTTQRHGVQAQPGGGSDGWLVMVKTRLAPAPRR